MNVKNWNKRQITKIAITLGVAILAGSASAAPQSTTPTIANEISMDSIFDSIWISFSSMHGPIVNPK